jgi:hypothetical protein
LECKYYIFTSEYECKCSQSTPTVSITSPSSGAVFTAPASFTITANATDDGAVSKVEFYNGTTKLGEDLTSPYSFTWSSVAAGSYSLTVKATDNATTSTTSSVVNISVNASNQAPTVSITAPANNTTFKAPATITINATASDADGHINKVEFYNGATKLGEDIAAPYELTWSDVAAGSYTLTAKAFDNTQDVTTSSKIDIVVNARNQEPSVFFRSPTSGTNYSTVPATISIRVGASDIDGSISKVEFYEGGNKLGESSTISGESYEFTWTNVSAGSYALTAKAIDNKGATSTSSGVSISVGAVNHAPTVNITSPSNPTNYNTAPASITIEASANDADGTITKVEFYNGATKLGEDAVAPYSFIWNNVPEGSYQVSVKAIDNEAAEGSSSSVTVNIGAPNLSPNVAILSPQEGDSRMASTDIEISASATDTDGSIKKVEFYKGKDKLGEDLEAPYSFIWKKVPAGKHSLTAKTIDNKGAYVSSAPVDISVVTENQAPEVSITSPINGGNYYKASNSIILEANAIDKDGSIKRVEFYANGVKLGKADNQPGKDNKNPYTYTWKKVNPGRYELIAKALDNTEVETTSAAVSIEVVPEIPPSTTARKTFEEEASAESVSKIRDISINAYPNPFFTEVTIEFILPETKDATVNIYNANGTLISRLFEGEAEAEKVYTVTFKAGTLSSGLYFIVVNTKNGVIYKKIHLVK